LVASLSERLGYCQAQTRQRLHALLHTLRLPLTYSGVSSTQVLAAMTHDKKALNGVVRFVLLQDIGSVVYNQEVPLEVLRSLLPQPA
jgi:3-dehydroquinate synthase